MDQRPGYPPLGYPPPRRPGPSTAVKFLSIVVIVTAAWVVYREVRERFLWTAVAPRTITPRGDLAADEQATIEIFENASPSVVYITNVAVRSDLFGLNVTEIPQGTGSGFVWDAAGHVVTNTHVIAGASGLKVTLSDHSNWDARVVGESPDKDLAVLWIGAPPGRLRPIPLGESHDLEVGQKVFAIGNPFGLDQTLTTGIVSALGRSIQAVTGRTIEDVIQTDAAINPGNSGGPLLDSAGRLIGVNTAIYSPSGSSAGIGFAVPADIINRVVPQLIEHGKVIRPQLGIVPGPGNIPHRLGVEGVLVLNVLEGGGAQGAGLRGTRRSENGSVLLGDIIVKVDDQPVASVDELLNALEQYKVGDDVTVTYLRDGETQTTPVTLH